MKKRMIIDITRMTGDNGRGIRTAIILQDSPPRCTRCSTFEARDEFDELALYADRCIPRDDYIPLIQDNFLSRMKSPADSYWLRRSAIG